MSAGGKGAYPGEPPLIVHREATLLAPQMQLAVRRSLLACTAEGIDAVIAETYRDRATAIAYWNRGRTQIPPVGTVTNAPNELWTWHGYGLAVDIIHRIKGWDVTTEWHAKVAVIFAKHGCKWGGHWNHPDLPHHQWGRCKPSPSDEARRILRESGLEAVWRAVGAA